jgi:hypothetical protein
LCGGPISSDKTEVWHQQTKRQNKESQKLVERQEHRIKGVCQKLDARVERQFLKQRAYVRDWLERRTKVKLDTGQQK